MAAEIFRVPHQCPGGDFAVRGVEAIPPLVDARICVGVANLRARCGAGGDLGRIEFQSKTAGDRTGGSSRVAGVLVGTQNNRSRQQGIAEHRGTTARRGSGRRRPFHAVPEDQILQRRARVVERYDKAACRSREGTKQVSRR